MTVKQMQCLLYYLGYYTGNIDGIAGRMTTQAATAFREAFFGISAEDIAQEETEKALRHAVAYGMPVRENTVERPTDTFWKNIEFFKREEFKCKCGGRYCGGYPVEPEELLVRLADRIRKHFGKPAYVVSGLRCKEWNRIQGGVANSQHMYGEAADLRIDGVTADELLEYIRQQPEIRYAYQINGTNVHFDIPKGKR